PGHRGRAGGVDKADGPGGLPGGGRSDHGLKAGGGEASPYRLDQLRRPEKENELVFGRRRRCIAIVEHELELPRGVREPEDEAGVAVVVLEGGDYRQSEQLVESGGRGEIPGWARDPELELLQRLRPPRRGTRLRPSPA